MTTDDPAPTPLSRTSRALTATVAYLRSAGDATAAEALQATLEERRSPGTVCLLGRAGAGRSTLLNALVGSPAALPASPAGVGTVTAAPVSVEADLGGTPVTVIDLPGLGVTASGPEGTADLFLAHADLALFIVDAHVPLSAAEATALYDALRLTPAVELVVTKRDQNLRGVREVTAADRRALVGAGLPTDFPVHVVSALPGIRDAGLDRLRERVVTRLTRENAAGAAADTATDDEAVNEAAVRQARMLVSWELEQQRVLAASDGDATAGVVADLDARLDRLTDLAGYNRTFLTEGLSAAHSAASSAYADDLAALQKRWRHYIDTTRPARILDDPAPVIDRLGSELSQLKQDALGRLMRAVRTDFLEYTEGAGRWEEVTGQIAASWTTATRASAPVEGEAPEKTRLGELVNPSLLTVTVSGGGAIAYAASLLPGVGGVVAATGGLAALPVIAAAGGWLTVNLLHTAAGKGRRNLRTWLDDTVAAARRDLTRDLGEVYHQLRPVVVNRYKIDITAYVAAEKERLSAARAELLAGRKDADNARDLAARRVAHLEKLEGMLG
ncbi:GTPase [Corynebacterium variabile]|uniref:50S ribosome-binding GTPase n=1 Tax=Corynebacterium variabile TaxID=1727 RepID=A0A0X2NM68_9CORY|nr:GTPase domain-containing protein [Corynebacterium variabile]CUU66587.1 50S ribosome-binding GTPase [Corynebacterium variabile]